MALPGSLMIPNVAVGPNTPVGFGGFPGFGFSLGFPQTLNTWQPWNAPISGEAQGVATFGAWDGRSTSLELSGYLDTEFNIDFSQLSFTGGRFWEARWQGFSANSHIFPVCPGDADINPNGFAALVGGNACQSYLGTLSAPLATGNQSYSGFGFTDLGAGTAPDVVIFFGSQSTGIGGCCAQAYGYSNGAVDAAGNRWCSSAKTIPGTGWTFFGGNCDVVERYGGFYTDRVIYLAGATACAQTGISAIHAYPYSPVSANWVSMDPSGFTLDWTAVDTVGGSQLPFAYLALKADPGRGQFKVGTLTQPAASVACGFDPDGVVVAGQGAIPADPDVALCAFLGIGMTDGNSQRCSFTGARGNHLGNGGGGPTHTSTYYSDSLITCGEPETQALLGKAHSTLVPGGFNLNWTVNDGNPRKFGWLAWQLQSDDSANPMVTTLPAVVLSGTSVMLRGEIIPNSVSPVQYQFFWRQLFTSWNSTPLTFDGSGATPTIVTALLTGLAPGIEYEFYLEVRVNTGVVLPSKGGYGLTCVVDGATLDVTPYAAPVFHNRFRTGEAAGPSTSDGFLYPGFASTDGLRLVGDAAHVGSVIRLTPAVTGQAGAVWTTAKAPVGAAFSTDIFFRVTLGGGFPGAHGPGGDGLTFAIQNSSATALGLGGGRMGYGAFISHCLVVEFDTFDNSGALGDPSDLSDNETSVHTNGTGYNDYGFATLLTRATLDPVVLKDGTLHHALIAYTPGTLQVTVDGVLYLTVPYTLTSLGLDDNTWAWIGMTAATGGAYQQVDIVAWAANWEPVVPQLHGSVFDLGFRTG